MKNHTSINNGDQLNKKKEIYSISTLDYSSVFDHYWLVVDYFFKRLNRLCTPSIMKYWHFTFQFIIFVTLHGLTINFIHNFLKFFLLISIFMCKMTILSSYFVLL